MFVINSSMKIELTMAHLCCNSSGSTSITDKQDVTMSKACY